jgi:hypothetical protein
MDQRIGSGGGDIGVVSQVISDIEDIVRLAAFGCAEQQKMAERIDAGVPYIRIAVEVVGGVEAARQVGQKEAKQGGIKPAQNTQKPNRQKRAREGIAQGGQRRV